MKRLWANILHGVAVAGQVANANHFLIPLKYQPHIAIALAVAQSIVGGIQHVTNPDGKPATLPWVKP